MAGTHARIRALLALVVGLLMLFTALAPVEASNAGEKGRKVRYPPARLWYRVALEFSGDADRESTYDWGSTVDRWSQAWRLESNTAVLVSLLCVDRKDPDAEPYFIKRKVRDRRRRVGGCPKNAPESHTDTLRFAARASGEWERHKHGWTFNYNSGCGNAEGPPYTAENSNELIGSQPLVGTISTPDSHRVGLVFGVDTTPPYGSWRSSSYESCEGDSQSNVEQRNWAGRLFGHVSHEVLAQPNWEAGWIPLNEYFKFGMPRGQFGRPLQHTPAPRQIAQPFGYPPPPGYTFQTSLYNKRYRYTFRLEPCPDGGRDVQNC